MAYRYRISEVFIFANCLVSVLNSRGNQIPKLQAYRMPGSHPSEVEILNLRDWLREQGGNVSDTVYWYNGGKWRVAFTERGYVPYMKKISRGGEG